MVNKDSQKVKTLALRPPVNLVEKTVEVGPMLLFQRLNLRRKNERHSLMNFALTRLICLIKNYSCAQVLIYFFVYQSHLNIFCIPINYDSLSNFIFMIFRIVFPSIRSKS